MIIKCGQCAYYDTQRQGCILLQIKCDPNEDFCSHATYEGKFCELCGKILSKDGSLQEGKDKSFHLICDKCATKIGTCATCEKATQCAFNEYNGHEQKFVMRKVVHGNLIMEEQIPNPAVVSETCGKGCQCFDEKNGCKRQNNNQCEHYSSSF